MGDHVAVDVGELVASGAGEPTGLVPGGKEEAEALIGMVECRICQEEDLAKNLESPCACSGSLKSYKPGYIAPPQVHHDETTIEISGGDWTISGTHLDLHDPRILAMAAAQHSLLEDEYDEYTATNNNAAAFCRSIFLILMALLLLRHTLTITNSDDEDDASAIFSLFLLRAAGFLLPCYIMAWAISIMQRQRQRQVGTDGNVLPFLSL
nr:unnamed protein product [Digitaria exilis]